MRKFFLFLGVLVLLFAAAVVVLWVSPPVHKAVFLWALEGKVDEVSVDRVRFTGGSFSVEKLDLASQGMRLTTDRAEVKASWLGIAKSRELHIEEVTVNGLRADLATMATASGGGLGAWLDLLGGEDDGPSEPFEGILAKMKASSQVSLGKLRLDGQVLLPEAQSVDINMTLDNLAVGEKARLRLQGAFIDAGKTSPVEHASYDFSVELDQTDVGDIQSLSGTLALVMMGEQLNPAGQIDLNGNWSLAKTSDGERLALYLAESGNPSPLIDTELEMNVGSGDMQGRLAANLQGALVPVSLLGLPPAVSSASLSTDGQVGWNHKTGVGRFDLKGAGILQERPFQYQFSGQGTTDSLPMIAGNIKTGFADEAGPGNLTVNLDVNSRGDGLVKIPVVVERGQRQSKLTVLSNIESYKMDPFQIALQGETVYLADLQSVGKALAAWGYGMQQLDTLADETVEIATTEAPAIPWEGISGKATVAIERLVLPQGHSFEGMQAEAYVSENAITLSSFTTRIDKGSIQGKGELLYTAGIETPFNLSATGEVRNIPSDLLDMGNGAPITGIWNGDLVAQGKAAQLEELADGIQMTLNVEGSSGVMEFSKINHTTGKASTALKLGSLLGQLMKDDRLIAISNMTDYLQRVPYDSIRVKMDRAATGQMLIQEFTLQGPELFLTGKGTVDSQSWATLAEGALDMSLAMATKGSFGQNAATLGLTGTKAAGEYQLWRQPIKISGTLSNPNYNALKDMILNALR
jgi:hypothetical protein